MAEPANNQDPSEAEEPLPSPLDDLPALMASMRRGAAMAHEIAARRPPRQVLGTHLVKFVELLVAAIEVGRLGGTVADIELRPADEDTLSNRYFWRPWIPHADSVCRDEVRDLAARGWAKDLLNHEPEEDLGRPLFLARRLFESALDHMRGVGQLLQIDGITRSPLALGRVALEGASRAWHVLDPDIDADQRLWRALNAELDALSETVAAGRREQDEEPMRQAGREMRSLLQRATALGASQSTNPGKRLDPYQRASAIVDLLLDRQDGAVYHGLSKIVHSQEDEGFRLMLGLADNSPAHPQRDRMIAMNLVAPLVALTEATNRLGKYTGWDLSAVVETQSGLLDLWSLASGFHDAQYEEQIEAEGWNVPVDADPEFWRRLQDDSTDE